MRGKRKTLMVLFGFFIWMALLEISTLYYEYAKNVKRKLSSESFLFLDRKLFETFEDFPNASNTNSEMKKRCLKPHRHFAYIKTHKTGSSTVFGVLHGFAKKHGLSTALKNPNPFLGGYPGRIREDLIFLPGTNNTFQLAKPSDDFVIHHHFRFNYTVLQKSMPPDTLIVSIVREPWKNFQSSFYYYYQDIQPKYTRGSTCFHFPFYHIAKGQRINISDYLELAYEQLNSSVPWYFRSKNYQSHDLGLDPLLEIDNEIKRAISKLEKEIDFMMITDYMDESMILLKDLFCMEWTDILFLDVGKTHSYTPTHLEAHTDVSKKFEYLYKLDIAMYKHFNETFWKKVEIYGRIRMMKDLKRLRNLRADYQNTVSTTRHKDESRKELNKIDFDKLNAQFFQYLQNRYNLKTMKRDLVLKILNQDSRINSTLAKVISNYMIENQGGCPA